MKHILPHTNDHDHDHARSTHSRHRYSQLLCRINSFFDPLTILPWATIFGFPSGGGPTITHVEGDVATAYFLATVYGADSYSSAAYLLDNTFPYILNPEVSAWHTLVE